MKIIHRYSVNTRKAAVLIQRLDDLGIRLIKGPIVTSFEISESDDLYPCLVELMQAVDPVHLVATSFSEREKAAACFLRLTAAWLHGYPVPTDDMGYRSISYDLKDYCELCGVGKVQKGPFRFKGEPSWGKNHVMQLNWVYDVFFVRPEIYRAVFAPLGISSLPVMNSGGTRNLATVVQLVPTKLTVPPLDLGDCPVAKCVKCGRNKYERHNRGLFPSFQNEVSGDYFHTIEWFGSGAEAAHEVIVSQSLFKKMNELEIKGASFVPINLTKE